MLPYNSPPADIFPETHTENGNTPVLSTAAIFITVRKSSKKTLFQAIFGILINLKPFKNTTCSNQIQQLKLCIIIYISNFYD